jgi:hypothetical protein
MVTPCTAQVEAIRGALSAVGIITEQGRGGGRRGAGAGGDTMLAMSSPVEGHPAPHGGAAAKSGGTVSGTDGIYAKDAAASMVNAGSIGGSANTSAGILLNGGGSVTNQAGGAISGYDGINALSNPATVVNAGVMAGSYTNNNADGVYLCRRAGRSPTSRAAGSAATTMASGSPAPAAPWSTWEPSNRTISPAKPAGPLRFLVATPKC